MSDRMRGNLGVLIWLPAVYVLDQGACLWLERHHIESAGFAWIIAVLLAVVIGKGLEGVGLWPDTKPVSCPRQTDD